MIDIDMGKLVWVLYILAFFDCYDTGWITPGNPDELSGTLRILLTSFIISRIYPHYQLCAGKEFCHRYITFFSLLLKAYFKLLNFFPGTEYYISMELKVTSFTDSSVIQFVYHNVNADWGGIFIKADGKVRFKYRQGPGQTFAETEVDITLDTWHRVEQFRIKLLDKVNKY